MPVCPLGIGPQVAVPKFNLVPLPIRCYLARLHDVRDLHSFEEAIGIENDSDGRERCVHINNIPHGLVDPFGNQIRNELTPTCSR